LASRSFCACAAGLLDESAFRETRDEARVQLDRERRLACAMSAIAAATIRQPKIFTQKV
jgi:hypothetical protein